MSAALIVFAVALLIGAPIALVMVFSGLAGAMSLGGIEFLEIVADRMFSGVSGFLLMAIPYFILTAELMNRAGLTQRLIDFNNALLGRVRGALSHVNITSSLFFAGLTGAAITDCVAIGKLLIPAMKKEGYPAAYAAAVTACASVIGPIIPPSIVMVVYATILYDVSVISLFVAGVVPGLLLAAALLIVSFYLAWRRNFPVHGAASLRLAVRAFLPTVPALLVPLIILGGILSGLSTVTEASAFAVVFAIAVGTLLYRTLTWRDVFDALMTTVRLSGVVFFLLGASTVLGWFVARSGITREAAELIAGFSTDPLVQILMVNLLLLVLGTVVDVLPALVIVAPVLAPAMTQLGFDPLHFAMVMILALNVGNITPPVGMTLMTASQIAGVSYESAIRASLPFYVSFIAVIAIVSVWPQMVLWLPGLLK
ncbi:MAG TPA: TRAP transporter large permease [Burkholderiales bacterium]|jgi:tripartite ATP-independent transporter DctM subunit|nr:TRAP transporter large permease [Burkholderiales bacterium]